MHGIALYQLLSGKQRRLSAHLTLARPLKDKERTKAKFTDSWNKIEKITFYDKFHFAFLTRF